MGRAVLALLALCGAADGALRGAVAPRDADEQRAKSRRALEEIEVVPAAEAAALAEQQAAAAAMAKAEAMMAAAKAAQAKAEADELEARAGATTTAAAVERVETEAAPEAEAAPRPRPRPRPTRRPRPRRRRAETAAVAAAAAPVAALAREAYGLAVELRRSLEKEEALVASLRAKLAALRGGEAGADLTAATWNMAAVNNNPFEYWITYHGEGREAYEALMAGVGALIEAPGDADVPLSDVFTDAMFAELRARLEAAGFEGLDAVAEIWEADYKHRKIVSGFLKDAALGAKRLVSMPDRVTNTISAGGATRTRPTVINCYRGGDLGDVASWWAAWQKFMFDEVVAVGDASKSPAAMLPPIKKSKYPAITEAEEAISRPLSAAATGADWQQIRGAMCDALNDRKYDRTASILETTYADADVTYEFLAPGDADPKRDQNSLVLLKRGAWAGATDVTADVVAVLADAAEAAGGRAPVAPGDLAAVAATRGGDAYLLVSFHGDTNGLATKPVLDAFSSLGMASSYGTADAPAWSSTTFNARTFLQPQLNKAVKREDRFDSPSVDRNPKDFILFYASDFSLLSASKDNTGDGASRA
ncbi:hypothetical protein JL722_3756 [Aureococcus anophagefferens]|nr:hypothetical protein JL722_3756 [Aureococcus anophagefferens]